MRKKILILLTLMMLLIVFITPTWFYNDQLNFTDSFVCVLSLLNLLIFFKGNKFFTYYFISTFAAILYCLTSVTSFGHLENYVAFRVKYFSEIKSMHAHMKVFEAISLSLFTFYVLLSLSLLVLGAIHTMRARRWHQYN